MSINDFPSAGPIVLVTRSLQNKEVKLSSSGIWAVAPEAD